MTTSQAERPAHRNGSIAADGYLFGSALNSDYYTNRNAGDGVVAKLGEPTPRGEEVLNQVDQAIRTHGAENIRAILVQVRRSKDEKRAFWKLWEDKDLITKKVVIVPDPFVLRYNRDRLAIAAFEETLPRKTKTRLLPIALALVAGLALGAAGMKYFDNKPPAPVVASPSYKGPTEELKFTNLDPLFADYSSATGYCQARVAENLAEIKPFNPFLPRDALRYQTFSQEQPLTDSAAVEYCVDYIGKANPNSAEYRENVRGARGVVVQKDLYLPHNFTFKVPRDWNSFFQSHPKLVVD